MITTTVYSTLIRTEFTAGDGTQFVFITYTARGFRRVEVYAVDSADGLEMFKGFVDPAEPITAPKFRRIAAGLIYHSAKLEGLGIALTPASEWQEARPRSTY